MRFTKKSYSIRKGIIKIEDLLQKNSLNESTKVKIADYLVRFKNLIFNDSYNYEEKPNYKSFKKSYLSYYIKYPSSKSNRL